MTKPFAFAVAGVIDPGKPPANGVNDPGYSKPPASGVNDLGYSKPPASGVDDPGYSKPSKPADSSFVIHSNKP